MDSLDDMKLPKSSEQEELEQISKDKLRPLFDVKLFQFREETYRDKGLDINFELKYKSKYTDFRFNVQLKSTQTKEKNKDGTYSWQIKTSNIQYLFNSNSLSYYIFYVEKDNIFYFEKVGQFSNQLSLKNKNWNKQESHTLRVSKILNDEVIQEIYNEVFEWGRALREIKEKIHAYNFNSFSRKVSIISDLESTSKLKVTDETSIVEFIEEEGLGLVNVGKSNYLISLNEKVSSNVTSPLYNFILGIAAYNTSKFYESLVFLRKAKVNLPEKLHDFLTYYKALVEFSIGIINKSEYLKIIESLNQTDHIKYYIELDLIKSSYINSRNPPDFEKFKNDIFELVDKAQVDTNLIQTAKCEYFHIWGNLICNDFLTELSNIKLLELENGPNLDLRVESRNFLDLKIKEWQNFGKELLTNITKSNNHFTLNLYGLYQIRVQFEVEVIGSILRLEKISNDVPDPNFDHLEVYIHKLTDITDFYKSINQVENLVATLAAKYEILLFLEKQKEAQVVIEEMQRYIDIYDLKSQQQKLTGLKNGYTTENLLKSIISETVIKPEKEAEIVKKLEQSINNFNELDYKDDYNEKDQFAINLFPLGEFLVPKGKVDEFYKLLRVDNQSVIKEISRLFKKGFVPALNLYVENQTEEGYQNGYSDCKGIESLKKLSQIREKLFKNKYRLRKNK